MRSQMKRGFTLIELLVVIAIIAILASILFPVFAKAREQARKATCISQVRQIAVAIQMYAQDNGGVYPGTDWKTQTSSYLGASDKMYQCPSDNTEAASLVSSYGYAGILVTGSGGVKESQVISPSEVGCVADATPSSGGLIGGGALQAYVNNGVEPAARHSKGVVAGFCDGHAKYFPGSFNAKDMGNGIARAFYQVTSLGLIDNAVGGLTGGSFTSSAKVEVGGEYATSPLIMAAAKMASGGYASRGFLGQSYTNGRSTDYCWGTVSNTATTGIANFALVAIVAKNSKIGGIGSLTNSAYVKSTAWIAYCYSSPSGTGYTANSVQSLRLPATSQLNAYAATYMGIPSLGGSETVEVANDAEMVDKVANDPYAIGYCASPFADPDRVVVISLSATEVYPAANAKYRWVMPTTGVVWPSTLIMKVLTSTGGAGSSFSTALNQGGTLYTALRSGPLFAAGYW